MTSQGFILLSVFQHGRPRGGDSQVWVLLSHFILTSAQLLQHFGFNKKTTEGMFKSNISVSIRPFQNPLNQQQLK